MSSDGFFNVTNGVIEITKIRISNVLVYYEQKKADIFVELFDSQGFICTKRVEMIGQDYEDWGLSDMPHLMNVICDKLDLTIE